MDSEDIKMEAGGGPMAEEVTEDTVTGDQQVTTVAGHQQDSDHVNAAGSSGVLGSDLDAALASSIQIQEELVSPQIFCQHSGLTRQKHYHDFCLFC